MSTILYNLYLQEERLRKENEKLYQDEDAKIKAVEEDDLTPHQRYSKLCELLSKSKFYSNFLLEKMEKEDEESRNLKNKNLAGRKTRKEATLDQVTLDIFLIVILVNFIILFTFRKLV